MKNLHHPFITKLIDDFIDSDGYLCMVQELYLEGDLSKFLRNRERKLFSEKEILRFLANMIMVVHDINSRNIFNIGLKPANFLVKRDKKGTIYLNLTDFGTAQSSIFDYDRRSSSEGRVEGTIEYMAPEVLHDMTAKADMTKQDVWAIGVIAYEISTFTLPFLRPTATATIHAIINDPHKPIAHQNYSPGLKSLIDQILTKDPAQRPSI